MIALRHWDGDRLKQEFVAAWFTQMQLRIKAYWDLGDLERLQAEVGALNNAIQYGRIPESHYNIVEWPG